MKFVKVCPVALRKESVDRNNSLESKQIDPSVSLSARRAWIEIVITAMTSQISVSLSARRAWIEIVTKTPIGCVYMCRSPQGERG